MDDRRAALRRRLADLRRQLRRGVDGATLDALLSEGASVQAELAPPQQRARRAWGRSTREKMRTKR
jgi:hypothetical protein